MTRAFVVALLGAESTGKTTLAKELCTALAAHGTPVVVVPEYLREFCDTVARTPRREEQAAIAAEQTRRIDAAARANPGGIVIADTTALMIAVYSEQVFGDASLYEQAQADHARCDASLLTALDLPWLADGLQRDGPHVRDPVDARVRAALARAGRSYAVVSGTGGHRLAGALAAIARAMNPPATETVGDASPSRWHWHCERCGDAACERHRLLPDTGDTL